MEFIDKSLPWLIVLSFFVAAGLMTTLTGCYRQVIKMTKQDYIRKLKKQAGAEADFITRSQIAAMLGIKKVDHVAKYVQGLTRLSGKYYCIDEVADRMIQETR